MPVPSSSFRLWILTATHRAVIRNSIDNLRDSLLSASRPLCQALSFEDSPLLSNISFSGSHNKTAWRCSHLTTNANLELSTLDCSSPATRTHLFFGRPFTSSIIDAAKGNASTEVKSSGLNSRNGDWAPTKLQRPFRTIEKSKFDHARGKPGFSRKSNVVSTARPVSNIRRPQSHSSPPMRARRSFRGQISSLKFSRTENVRSHSDKKNVISSSRLLHRKRILSSQSRSPLRARRPFRGLRTWPENLQAENVRENFRNQNVISSGQATQSPSRMTSAVHSRLKLKMKTKLASGGLKLIRKRKRIRPCPQDITYKRTLNSDGVRPPVDIGQEPPILEKSSSLGSQFRRIQPSRELLTYIKENFLGRRRLTEWRKGGFDPKRTAPLDDRPDDKERKNPILESIFRKKPTFIAAAKKSPSLPTLQYPEVAFAGRSNVGKSSLVNALTRRWGVARTSDKPGLTQSLNFFKLGEHLCLVDLPGYGFAYAKEELKEDWEELVKDYVQTRSNLKRVCLLVDAKWGLKPRDVELLHLMESASRRYQIVLTKTDVLPPLELARRATEILEALKGNRFLIRPLVMVSSKTGAGIQLFRSSLAKIASKES